MRRRLLLAALMFALLPAAQAQSYLILPFSNLSNNSSLDWIGESIAETAGEVLVSEGLIVLDRDDRQEAFRRLSIRPYSLLTKGSVIKVAETLDADQVIFGQFQFQPSTTPGDASRGSLQIRAQTIDMRKLKLGPEYAETGALEDLAALQSHLAWQMLSFLQPDRAPSEEEFRKRRTAVRVDALENYIRGLLAPAWEQKVKLFSQAARLDASFSQPLFHLGRMHWERRNYRAAVESFQKVSASDARHREATFYLGLCRYHLGDFAGAQAAFQLVQQEVPLNEVLNNLGAAQSRANSPEALNSFRKALEGDATDPNYHFNVGYALWKQSNFPAAAYEFRATLERDPNDADARMLLDYSERRIGPRPNDSRTSGLERLKSAYEERAYLQLKALLEQKK